MSIYRHTVIIPTCAEPNVIMKSVPRFFLHSHSDVHFIFSFNPITKKNAIKSERLIKFFFQELEESDQEDHCSYEIVHSEGPIGFGAAVNKGIKHMRDNYGVSEFVTIANDDLEVTAEWLEGLEQGFSTSLFTTSSLAQNEDYVSTEKLTGKVGMVGPVSNGVFNDQRLLNENTLQKLGLDLYAEYSKSAENLGYLPTTFLSGFCVCLSKECLEDMCSDEYDFGGVFDTRFKVGGFEDDDLCTRALQNGWMLFISSNTFIGHGLSQTLSKNFKDQMSGLKNGIDFLLKWEEETQRHQKVVAAYRTSLKCVNDLNQLHNSLLRSSQVLDGIAILLTNNPKEMLQSYDSIAFGHLTEVAQTFVNECKELPDNMSEAKEDLKIALTKFLKEIIPNTEVVVDVWDGDFNERDERNYTHEMAESMNCDFICSIDSDEIFEDRITKDHIQRILQNPRPDVNCYSIGFLNHWESMKLIREDKHYGKMQGFRMWKSYKSPLRIVAGNEIGFHCGNSPEYGGYGKRVSSIRMRHLSHVRQVDRDYKANFYNKIDTDKRVELIGSADYGHINQEDNIQVSLYNPKNGLAFTMLCYEKENWIDIMAWLDRIYSVSDRICLVWTGEWNEEDQDWMTQYGNIKDLSKEEYEKRYRTGPSWELAQLSRLYKVDWQYQKLDERGLAVCRNAGIDYLHQTNDGTLGWVMFMDPDEVVGSNIGFGMHLVNMTQKSDCYGYMFKFNNPVNTTGKFSGSESIRLVQLNSHIRLSGVVHETFEQSFKIMRENGTHPNVKYYQQKILNRGLNKTSEDMARKLLMYRDYLVKELEKNPYHTGSWVSLALQYLNDDDYENAETCFSRAILCNNGAYLPFKEYAFFLIRKAHALLVESYKRTNSSHNFHKISAEMINTFQSWKLDLPKVDTGGVSISETTVLPLFPHPEEFAKMKLAMKSQEQEILKRWEDNEVHNQVETDKDEKC